MTSSALYGKQKNELCRRHCLCTANDSLMHHGIFGMHWGERNGPPYPLSKSISDKVVKKALQLSPDQKMAIKNIRSARTANLDKLGTSPDNNILFIAGYSGSGKSTTAIGFKRQGDQVIHLDAYSEPENPDTLKARNRKLDAYLDRTVKGWRRMPNAEKGAVKPFSKEYWSIVDDFRSAIENFSKQEYKQGHRVIVEGVQLADEWFVEDRSYYSGKPMIVLGTNPISSMNRAAKREGAKNFVKRVVSLENPKDYISWYARTHKNLNRLASASGANRKYDQVKEAIRRIGEP